MTPEIYSKFSIQLKKAVHYLWIWFLTSVFFLFILVKFWLETLNDLFLFTAAAAGAAVSWGLLLVRYWFNEKNSDKVVRAAGIMKPLRIAGRWYAAFFLNLWFLTVIMAVSVSLRRFL